MEQSLDSATNYYNNNRKRSFFLSRIFVIVSMLVLVVTLGINISVLYSQQRTSTTSQAASVSKPSDLPTLPKGCEYQSKGKGVVVVCPTESPKVTGTTEANEQFPINVRLPKLPAQCDYIDSAAGIALQCGSPKPVVPTVAVSEITSCVPGATKDTLDCSDAQSKKVVVALPSLPQGCVYKLVATKYFVDCNEASVQNAEEVIDR